MKRDPDSENVALAIAIAEKQIDEHPPEQVIWNWEEAVMMLGMTALFRVTGDQAFLEYVRDWMDHHIENGYYIATSDSCSPAALAIVLHAEYEDAKYRVVMDDAVDYLFERALRTGEGGISHLGDAPVVTLWADSLFMFGNVLILLGELEDDTTAINEFSSQFSIFAALLQKESGFFSHAYQWPGADPDVFWGRGNGWVAASAYQYLRVRRNRGETDEGVEDAATRLTGALIEVQDEETGLWWTVLDRPGDTYLETSSTALFSFALARAYRYGFAGHDALAVVANAVAGVKSRIESDAQGRPVVTGISGATGAGTFKNYAAIETVDDTPFGIGAVILALLESSGLP